MKKVRVLLVDDHSTFREAFQALLDAHGEFEVVGHATHAAEVVPTYEASAPDLVVMDVALERGDGASACQELTLRYPSAKVLMLSAHALHDYVARALAAGAVGYALKSQPAAEVVQGMTKVMAGERYLAPALPETLLTK
jgi:DNA-binding NarL/FixJ family response regulator